MWSYFFEATNSLHNTLTWELFSPKAPNSLLNYIHWLTKELIGFRGNSLELTFGGKF